MKLIDLLNKIANGEEVPNKFKYDNLIFKKRWDNAYFDNDGDDLHDSLCIDFSNLNDEVEIIEEEKKIPEKLNIKLNSGDENKVNCYSATNLECDLAFKINGIIDYLQSKGE